MARLNKLLARLWPFFYANSCGGRKTSHFPYFTASFSDFDTCWANDVLAQWKTRIECDCIR